MLRTLLAMLVVSAVACVGVIEDPAEIAAGDPMAKGPGGTATDGAPIYQRSGLRRLTQNELRSTIKDLTGVDPIANIGLLPDDSTPFDNDYTDQYPSGRLVAAAKTMAESVAAKVVDDAALFARLVVCTTADSACMTQFITTFGRRAVRHPLGQQEVAELAALAGQQPDFKTGVAVVIRTLLQDLEFLYLVERGSPAGPADLFRLNGWEVASRLSYLLWGSMPNDQLLDLAARDGLRSPADVRQAASRILAGTLGGMTVAKRARERVSRFHAMWLGYEQAPLPPAVASRMRAETNALVERVIFDKRTSWLDLFRSKESFVDDTLATFYGDGMTRPGSATPTWAPYGASKRQGILSHGTFLSVANGPAETSVTLRGKNVRNTLLCQEIAAPPPNLTLGGQPVDTTRSPEPGPNECRIDVIKRTTLSPGCAGCHNQMDLIGLGLERYDMTGKYRTTDDKKPTCRIAGEGQLQMEEGLKTFQGPAGLSELLVATQAKTLGRCLTSQFLRFATGREIRDDESRLVDTMDKTFQDGGLLFDDLLLAYVSSAGFGHRLVE